MTYRSSLSLPRQLTSVRIEAGAAQSIPNGGAATVLVMDYSYVTGAAAGNLTANLTNNRIEINTTGVYHIVGNICYGNSSSRRILSYYLNGVENGRTEVGTLAASASLAVNVSGQQLFTAGQYIDLRTYQNTGAAANTAFGTSPAFLALTRVA